MLAQVVEWLSSSQACRVQIPPIWMPVFPLWGIWEKLLHFLGNQWHRLFLPTSNHSSRLWIVKSKKIFCPKKSRFSKPCIWQSFKKRGKVHFGFQVNNERVQVDRSVEIRPYSLGVRRKFSRIWSNAVDWKNWHIFPCIWWVIFDLPIIKKVLEGTINFFCFFFNFKLDISS